MQPQHRATLTQPLQCDLQRLSCKTQKNYAQRCRKLQLQNRISTPKQKKGDFEAFFKRIFKRKITSAKVEKICWQTTIAAWMQPFQYDLRCSAAKDNSITHAAAAPSNLDAATTMPSAETELQNTKELRATVSKIAASKPDLDAKAEKRRFWSIFSNDFKRKITSAIVEKICWQITIAAWMQPFQYELRCSAQKTIVLRMQRHEATLTQPLHCDLQRLSCKTQ